MNDILKIQRNVNYDNSITKYEYHTYSPFLTSFNNNEEIRISIQHQDLCVLPSESFIYIEGKTTKLDGSVVEKTNIANNGVSFLFDEIRYELNGHELDKTRNVGITSTLKNFVSLNSNESKMLLNAGWLCPDKWFANEAVDVKLETTKGYFNFCIPLKTLLGFAEDYKKVIMNAKHELILVRTRTDENFYVNPTDTLKVDISKIQWRVPHITVSEEEKLTLMKVIERGLSIPMSFRSWDIYEYPVLPTATQHTWTVKTATQLEKPRFVIFALQTDKKNQRAKDVSLFDHCRLSDIKLYLNSETYPYDNLNINFNDARFALLYLMYVQFQQSYYGRNCESVLSREDFKNFAPIVVLDCSRQNETIKSGSVDVRLEFKTSENIPANTSAYCLLLHDRIVEYNPLTSVVRKLV